MLKLDRNKLGNMLRCSEKMGNGQSVQLKCDHFLLLVFFVIALGIWFYYKIGENVLSWEIENVYVVYLHLLVFWVGTLICSIFVFKRLLDKNHEFYWDKKYYRINAILFGLLYLLALSTLCFFVLSSNEWFLLIFFATFVTRLAHNIFTKKEYKDYEVKEEKDLLFRTRFFNRTTDRIREIAQNSREGITIGIIGSWGTGKTFFVDQILWRLSKYRNNETGDNNQQNKDDFVICDKIELWKNQSIDEAWECVIESLSRAIFGNNSLCPNIIKKWVNFVLKLCGTRYVSAFDEMSALVFARVNNKHLEQINELMEDKKYVLVFDDLERADITIIQAMLPLFERLKKLPNLIVICAIAEDELKEIFRKNKLQDYIVDGHLNKIFDLRIEIPALSYASIEHYQEQLFATKYKDCNLVNSFLNNYPLRFKSVREMMRVLDKLTFIERQFYGECPYIFTKQEEGENKDVLASIKYVFLIEALKLADKSVIKYCLPTGIKVGEFFKGIPPEIVSFSTYSITEDYCDINSVNPYYSESQKKQAEESIDEWKTRFPQAFKIIVENLCVRSIFIHIKADFTRTASVGNKLDYNRRFYEALLGFYTRSKCLLQWEKEEILSNDKYANLSYTEKIESFFSEKNEILETSSQSAVANELLEFHVDKIGLILALNSDNGNIDSDGLRSLQKLFENLCFSLRKEYECGDASYLRFSNYLDRSNYISYIEKFWKLENFSGANIQVLRNEAISNLFDLMPLDEKGFLLTNYWYGLSDNSHNRNNKLYYESIIHFPEYQGIIKEFHFKYGKLFADFLFKGEFCSSSKRLRAYNPLQVYKRIKIEENIKEFYLGFDSFLDNELDRSVYIVNWIKFMKQQYSDASLWGGTISSFADEDVYVYMKHIYDLFKITPEYIANLSNKDDICNECDESIKILQEDCKQWVECNNQGYKDKYGIGIKKIIELISKIRDYASVKS